MLDQHPDAELAPRDVVARGIFAETQAGRRPMLDTRAALGAEVLTRCPALAETCARAGIDPVKDPIPVAVAAHYHMGGIETDMHGRASLDRLWVSGEAASTGLHGANRLASNGLLEALVYARRAARDIADTITKPKAPVAELHPAFQAATSSMDADAVQQLRQTMTAHVGMRRNAEGLRQALATLQALEAAQSQDEAFLNMCATATLIAACALERRESRGGHFRTDFPQADPALAQRSQTTLSAAHALRNKVIQSL